VRVCGVRPCPLAKLMPACNALAIALKPAWFGEPMLASVIFLAK